MFGRKFTKYMQYFSHTRDILVIYMRDSSQIQQIYEIFYLYILVTNMKVSSEIHRIYVIFHSNSSQIPHIYTPQKSLFYLIILFFDWWFVFNNNKLHFIFLKRFSRNLICTSLTAYYSIKPCCNQRGYTVWPYGVPLYHLTLKTIQAFQAIYLRLIDKAPWYVINIALHKDLQMPTIKQTATTYYLRLHYSMKHHPNTLIVQLHSKELPGNPDKRQKCEWPRDLLNAYYI